MNRPRIGGQLKNNEIYKRYKMYLKFNQTF
jgi:hypothetical protein